MSETMCPDPYPMCPQKNCGFPICGCRYLGCVNPSCRANQLEQGVELKYKPVSEFEFIEKFDSQEAPWRPSTRVTHPTYGYEAPYRPIRHVYDLSTDTLDCNAIPTKEKHWRAQRKYFPGPTGALSEDPRRHRKYFAPVAPVEPPVDPPCKASARCYESLTSEKDWRPSRHQSGKAGSETTQQDFHPHRRYIPRAGSTSTIRHAIKAPGFYKRNAGEWLPPFRASTPEMISAQGPGCILWQCPKTGRKAAPCRQSEWQPDFRSNSQSVPSTPYRPSRQGLKQIHRRPDEWCPPWKQQQQCVDDCHDPLIQRNATINEDANCTHYLDNDAYEREGSLRDKPAAETENEGEGKGEDKGEGDESPEDGDDLGKEESHKDYTSCDACARNARRPATCWSTEDDVL